MDEKDDASGDLPVSVSAGHEVHAVESVLHMSSAAAPRRPGPRQVGSPDRRLMADVAAGEPGAQRRLAKRLLPELRRVVSKIIRGPDLDDAVQVALIEVLRSAKNYRGEGSVEAWAQRVALRRAMRFWNKEQRNRERLADAAEPEDLVAETGDRSLVESLPRPIEHYLDRISEVQRVAIVLRHGFGYSLQDIGGMTDTDPNTVKARLLHGRRRLRALVAADLEATGGEA